MKNTFSFIGFGSALSLNGYKADPGVSVHGSKERNGCGGKGGCNGKERNGCGGKGGCNGKSACNGISR